MLTTKKLHLRSIIHELIWFLRGDTNIAWLKENGVNIWNEWADKEGNLGPVYGHRWRSWPLPGGGHVDQITQAIDTIRNNPDSRRIIVSAWNVADIGKMALPPRSEEHTSELQSLMRNSYAVFCLTKKKRNNTNT